MRKLTFTSLLSLIAVLAAGSIGYGDVRWTPSANACLIEINNRGAADYTRWAAGTLTGMASCTASIGTQIDYDHPRYIERAVCYCVGANHGRDDAKKVAVALCRDRGDAKGPRDSKLLIWCDAVPNLAGAWKCVGSCSGPTSITQTGRTLTLTNERTPPDTSKAYFADSTTVVAEKWPVRGTVSSDGKTIDWGNGTKWVR